jgi:hypothetical protein
MSDDTWARPAGVPLPTRALLSAAGFAPSGEALVAGADYDTQTGFILDERGGWSRHDFAFGGVSFATAPEIVRVAGYASNNNVVMKSSAPDVWIPESIPFPGPVNEHGIKDICVGDGVFYACGFDDGGDGSPEFPHQVLFQSDEAGGWVRIEVPCGGCSDREFRAVAITSQGGLLLGGAITNFSGGSPDMYRAFLIHYTGGNWEEIVLPEPGALDRVNDILVTTNGDIYLACGMETGFIVRLPVGGTGEREAAIPAARISALAQSAEAIWAAGEIFVGTAEASRPGLWKRLE